MKTRHFSLISAGFFCVCAGLLAEPSPAPSQASKPVEPEIEIVHRTLAQAPDGTPDNRSAVGIGEWLEFRVLPETENRVEWIVTGGGKVSNRFGNASIIIVGGSGSPGGLSVSAKVHDIPPSTSPEEREEADSNDHDSGRRIAEAVKALDGLLDSLPRFEVQCAQVVTQLRPFAKSTRQVSLSEFTALLSKIDAIALKVPDSRDWAQFQRLVMEAAIHRMALHLDDTPDNESLGKEHWEFLHACTNSLARLQADFEAAGGHSNSRSGPSSASLSAVERRRSEVANTLAGSFPSLWDFLRVQIRNSLPGKPASEHRAALKALGFSETELQAVFGNE